MRITNINKNAKLQFKTQNFEFHLAVFTFAFFLLPFLFGCVQKSAQEKAQEYARQSTIYYQRAITQYKDLISKGKDLNKLNFELGKLYYKHKDFREAAEAFKNTNNPEAKKLMAASYYQLGDYRGALEIFNKENVTEDEYLYYFGLTAEKLNLFDKALELYKKIKSGNFLQRAQEQINTIEKQARAGFIDEVDPAAYKVIQEAPRGEDYPQAGALILLCDEKIRINDDDTQVSSLHYIVKIINERGKEEFAETQISYDSTYEKVELEYARTIKPDGRVVDVGSRHIRDVSRYLNFPLYSNARVYIISFPEIAEGAIIEYKVNIYRSQLVNKKDFIVDYPVQAAEPIISASFIVDIPQGRALYIKTLNEEYNDFGADLKPQIQQLQGRITYKWGFKNITQIIPESNMPPAAQINPAMLISTFSSWQEIYDWWWKLAKDRIESDSAIKEQVRELISRHNSDEDKIKAIYNFCAQKIRYVAVAYGQAGYQPHFAADIFKNKYGDCKDQAILLITMLKEAGFQAYPVLIPTKGSYNLDESFPAIFFNHCIASVVAGGKMVFLDPTAETCPFGDLPIDDQARDALIFKEDSYKIQHIPRYSAEHNTVKQEISIKINAAENINAQKSVFTYGMFDQAQRYWMLYTPPELIEDQLKRSIQDVSIGATLDHYEIKNLNDLNKPIELSYKFNGPEYFTQAGSSRIMPQLAYIDTSLVAKAKRRYPIDFAALDNKETFLEVQLPQNLAIKFMPEEIDEVSPWLEFSAKYNYRDSKITFLQKAKLKKDFITTEEYPEFKTFFEKLAKKTKQRVVLEKTR